MLSFYLWSVYICAGTTVIGNLLINLSLKKENYKLKGQKWIVLTDYLPIFNIIMTIIAISAILILLNATKEELKSYEKTGYVEAI